MSIEAAEANRFYDPEIYNENGSYTKEYAWGLISERVNLVSGNVQKIAEMRAPRWRPGPELPSESKAYSLFFREDVEVEEVAVNHPNSSAKYAVSAHKGRYFRFTAPDDKECILFLWGMEPDGETSQPPHVHGMNPNGRGVYEHHFVLAGEIIVNGDVITSGAESLYADNKTVNYHKASPGETHSAKAGENGAVVAILLENVRDIPDADIHLPFVKSGSGNQIINS